MSSTNIKKILIVIVFTILGVADFALGSLGYSVGVSLSAYLFFYLMSIGRINNMIYFFVFGFILDLISTSSAFGFFSLTFLLFGTLFKLLSNTIPRELLGLILYFSTIVLFNILFASPNIYIIFSSIISYLAFRLVSLIIFKK